MHSAIQFLEFWALAFATLCAALVLLNVFDSLIGNGLVLRSAGKEAVIASIASLVEGAGVWLVVTFVPAASRALIVPAILVALIFKVSHLEDWSRYDVFMLLLFQIVVGFVGASLFAGHFGTAIIILAAFAAILTIIAGFAKSL